MLTLTFLEQPKKQIDDQKDFDRSLTILNSKKICRYFLFQKKLNKFTLNPIMCKSSYREYVKN
jgi:hypothetical protein